MLSLLNEIVDYLSSCAMKFNDFLVIYYQSPADGSRSPVGVCAAAWQ
ncbi:hypothetical protein NTGM5_10094 [Candidatus Nitrotoga sp. M5]|nr:hypothetical protein NTGM5_10094 [Candidatus Nitrotoga sp. M5]